MITNLRDVKDEQFIILTHQMEKDCGKFETKFWFNFNSKYLVFSHFRTRLYKRNIEIDNWILCIAFSYMEYSFCGIFNDILPMNPQKQHLKQGIKILLSDVENVCICFGRFSFDKTTIMALQLCLLVVIGKVVGIAHHRFLK